MKRRSVWMPLMAIAVIMASGCSVSKRIDKWVGRHYNETIPTKVKANDYITFTFENSIPADHVSATQRTNNKLVPALFYWQWKYETSSTLNVMLPMGNFTKSFISAANKRNLKQKLNGASVQISLTGNPADFKYHEDGWLVYMVLAYTSKSKIFVEPARSEFAINYSVALPSGEMKTGTVSVANPNREKAPRFFQSIKGAINEYLSMSDANVAGMAQELADKLVVDLMAGGVAKQ